MLAYVLNLEMPVLVCRPAALAFLCIQGEAHSLLQVVSLETANDGITCNAICPGYVMTPMVEPWIQEMASQEGVSFEEATKRVLAVQPLQRFAHPDEIGDLVAFLCSRSAKSITGTALEISGGWTAR